MARQRTALLVLLALPLASCGTNWTVVKAAEPNPFYDQSAFKLLPLEFVDLQVDGKPEAEYVGGLKPESVSSWEGDKDGIQSHFKSRMIDRADGEDIALGDTGEFVIKPTVSSIETGYYRIPAFYAITRIHLRLQISDTEGTVLDEVLFVPAAAWDLFNPTTGGRLRTCAKAMGKWAADYLAERTTTK